MVGVRYDAEGAEGLQDRRIGRASARAVPGDDVVAMPALYHTSYTGAHRKKRPRKSCLG